MSAADTHEQSDNLLRYAPAGVRQPHDDGPIRPVLERLSRGASDSGGARFALPPVEQTGRVSNRGVRWSLVVACTVAAGASAGLAVAAFAWMAPVQHEAPQPKTVDLTPKQVQTVSFKQQDRLADEAPVASQPDVPAAATQANASAQDGDATVNQTQTAAAAPSPLPAQAGKTIAPKDLIALWSGVPSDTAAQPADAAAPAQPAAASADDPPVDTPKAKPTHHRRAHARHRTHHGRRHVAHAQHAPVETAAPQTQEASAQPTGTPLQSAWQSLFGHPVASSGPASNAQAAFQ
jgi:hypothetical protein